MVVSRWLYIIIWPSTAKNKKYFQIARMLLSIHRQSLYRFTLFCKPVSVDALARVSMKNAARSEMQCESQSSVNHWFSNVSTAGTGDSYLLCLYQRVFFYNTVYFFWYTAMSWCFFLCWKWAKKSIETHDWYLDLVSKVQKTTLVYV